MNPKEKKNIKNATHKLNDTQSAQLTKENKVVSGGIISNWIKEFNDLCVDKTKAVKFVDYKEFRVTLLEFLDLKQKEFNDEQELIEKI